MLFKDIPGQAAVKQRLIESVLSNRVSHAQLFFGPEGCGKLALAIAYAQYINCRNRTPADACGVCPSCQKIQKLAHPDIHFSYPIASATGSKKLKSTDLLPEWRELLLENNAEITLEEWYTSIELETKQGIISTDECNDIITKLNYKSYESEYRFQIIWMVERLYHAAAPKLLKILEEPPEKTIFILITETPDALLATIRSRTQLIKINKYSDDVIAAEISRIKQLSSDKLNYIVKLAQGNLKAAISLCEELENSDFNFNTFKELMRISFQLDLVKLQALIKTIGGIGRERQRKLISYGMRIVRACLLVNNGNAVLVKLPEDEFNWMINLAPYIHHGNIQRLEEEFSKALFHIERNGAGKIIFTDLAFKLNTLLKKQS